MKQLFCLFTFCFVAACATAQLDVSNTGVFYLSANTDTFFVSGNFSNTSTASFTNNGKIYLKQNYTNSQASTAVGTGEFVFNGTGAQLISTTSTSPFYQLSINKSSGLATLASSIIINNSINLNAGKLSLDNYDLIIDNGAVINGGASNTYLVATANGVLKQQISAMSSKTFPVGTADAYTPLTILLDGSSATDIFNVRMLPAVYSNGTSGSQMNSNSVNATWMIAESVPGGSNATLTCQWPSSLELTGFNRSFSRLAHYTSGAWDYGLTNIPAIGSDPYQVTRTGFTSFSPFVVTMYMAVLPVRALDLSGTHYNNQNHIKWSTAEERNSSYFVVEASKNAVDFFEVSRVNAAGNSTVLQQYNVVHKDINGQSYYYRIKQVDVNGQSYYSKVIRINLSAVSSVLMYPNPVKDRTAVRFTLKQTSVITKQISNTAGAIVYSSKQLYVKGDYTEVFNLAGLSAGTYTLQLKDDNGVLQTTQFIKIN